MKVRYFSDTDTLLIELRDAVAAETRDLDENTVLDFDLDGNICSITIEHASTRAGAPEFSYEQVAARSGRHIRLDTKIAPEIAECSIVSNGVALSHEPARR